MGLDQYICRVGTHEEVAYFRKNNALQAWIDKLDDVQVSRNYERIPLSLEAIAGLLTTVNRVLETPALAPELFPTKSGFFFGSTNYDDWYIMDLQEVRAVCESLLQQAADAVKTGDPVPEYYYIASY